MLIKTDSQNYTNIADSIRELTRGVLFDEDVTTGLLESDQTISGNSTTRIIIDDHLQKHGKQYSITCNNNNYICSLRGHWALDNGWSFLGNFNILFSDEIDTGEPFLIVLDNLDLTIFYTREPGTYNFTIKIPYKPEEMVDAITNIVPEYGIIYDKVDGNGVRSATTFGHTLSGLGGKYFMYLSSLNIPDTVRTVAPYAFYQSGLLLDLVLPYGVETIQPEAFYFSLLPSITLPDSVTELYPYSFSFCIGAKNINLSANITKIPSYAFFLCSQLTELIIPEKVDVIEYMAFSACSFTTVTFLGKPSAITSMLGMSAFFSCSDLTTINVPWSEGEVAGAPWGADKATINYNYVPEQEVIE